MDEQRMQAYVGLIEQLLDCPQGKETEILQANADLVDRGLVAVMGQYADWPESLGDRNAERLRQLAAELAQALGLWESESLLSQTQKDAVRFGVEIALLVAQPQEDWTQLHNFLQVNVERLDEALLKALPDVFTALIQQNNQLVIAGLFVRFGNLIREVPPNNSPQEWLRLDPVNCHV